MIGCFSHNWAQDLPCGIGDERQPFAAFGDLPRQFQAGGAAIDEEGGFRRDQFGGLFDDGALLAYMHVQARVKTGLIKRKGGGSLPAAIESPHRQHRRRSARGAYHGGGRDANDGESGGLAETTQRIRTGVAQLRAGTISLVGGPGARRRDALNRLRANPRRFNPGRLGLRPGRRDDPPAATSDLGAVR